MKEEFARDKAVGMDANKIPDDMVDAFVQLRTGGWIGDKKLELEVAIGGTNTKYYSAEIMMRRRQLGKMDSDYIDNLAKEGGATGQDIGEERFSAE